MLVVFRQCVQVHDVKTTSFTRTVYVTVAFAEHCEELHFLAFRKGLIKVRELTLKWGAQVFIRVVPTQIQDVKFD